MKQNVKMQLPCFEPEEMTSGIKPRIASELKPRANDLPGAECTKYSISVWNDIRKSKGELSFNHPAMFPEELVRRLILAFTRKEQIRILDPFMGSGSTVITAHKLNRLGIGFEISDEFIELFKSRLKNSVELELGENGQRIEPLIFQADARFIKDHLEKDSVDLCITSPPYWDILEQKRTADGKSIRNYGDSEKDIGKIKDYQEFLCELDRVWENVYYALKPGAYFIINVMDIRKKDKLFPLHIDTVSHCSGIGSPPFIFDDLIIWNRQSEYNNLRPLGYPYKFRINKVHEFLLIFQKPK